MPYPLNALSTISCALIVFFAAGAYFLNSFCRPRDTIAGMKYYLVETLLILICIITLEIGIVLLFPEKMDAALQHYRADLAVFAGVILLVDAVLALCLFFLKGWYERRCFLRGLFGPWWP